MAADPRDLLVGQHVGDDLGSQRRVHLDERALVWSQQVGFEQQRVRNPDLADVVHERRLLEQHQLLLTPPEARSEAHGHRGHPLRVPGCGGVFRVDRPGERPEGGHALAASETLRAFRRRELLDDLG
jgi:hypothetical protein